MVKEAILQYQFYYDQSVFCGTAKLAAGFRLISHARRNTDRSELKMTLLIISFQHLTVFLRKSFSDVSHKAKRPSICSAHLSLTNACFCPSKGGIPHWALWQFDILQVGHADHHPPVNVLVIKSFRSHFLYGQSSWGMEHQV